MKLFLAILIPFFSQAWFGPAFFSTVHHGKAGIASLGSDGLNQRHLTLSGSANGDAGLRTPKKGLIAFKARVDGNDEIMVMNRDGSGIRNLTDHPSQDRNPWWTPDGKTIFFETNRDGNWQVYSMNSDGSKPKRINKNKFEDKYFALSADGGRIVTMVVRNNRIGLVTMQSNGKKRKDITGFMEARRGLYYHFPRFSRDGKLLAFATNRDTRIRPTRNGDLGLEIYIANSEGLFARRLTYNKVEDSLPDFDPDGKHLIFGSARSGKYHIYRMTLEGKNVTALTEGDHSNWSARYSADGQEIVFVSNRSGEQAIHIMNRDGSMPRQLTSGIKGAGSPALFSPEP